GQPYGVPPRASGDVERAPLLWEKFLHGEQDRRGAAGETIVAIACVPSLPIGLGHGRMVAWKEMATGEQKYTAVAAKALSLHELFAVGFAKGLDGPVHFSVELSAPDGPSTGGGKQALQHIKLIPDGGGMAVVIGSADTALNVAEVRTFEHVVALYAQRFRGAPLPVDPARYAELCRTLAQFFDSLGMQVAVVP